MSFYSAIAESSLPASQSLNGGFRLDMATTPTGFRTFSSRVIAESLESGLPSSPDREGGRNGSFLGKRLNENGEGRG